MKNFSDNEWCVYRVYVICNIEYYICKNVCVVVCDCKSGEWFYGYFVIWQIVYGGLCFICFGGIYFNEGFFDVGDLLFFYV